MNEEEIKEKYLVQISTNGAEMGNGIIVGKYLLTAGHVVDGKVAVAHTKDGKRIELNKCVAMRNEEKVDCGLFCDFAVFELDRIESPLILAEELATEGEEYTSLSVEHIVTAYDSSNIFRCHDEQKSQAVKTKVVQHQGNFFACEMEKALKPGNSGSPLIKDGKVFGILHGGLESEDYPEQKGKVCVYMTAHAIIEAMASAGGSDVQSNRIIMNPTYEEVCDADFMRSMEHSIIQITSSDLKSFIHEAKCVVTFAGIGKGTKRMADAIADAMLHFKEMAGGHDFMSADRYMMLIGAGKSHPVMMTEFEPVNELLKTVGPEKECLWGLAEFPEQSDDTVSVKIMLAYTELK